MKTLIAGFEGEDNSAKILLDYIKKTWKGDILYLKNDFEVSSKQIEEKLLKKYDYVLIFGQKPNTQSIYLENNAKLEKTKLVTDFNYENIREKLKYNNYLVIDSYEAGKYLCNNVFFSALSFKQKNNLKSQIAFIHIPIVDNILDIKELSNVIIEYINKL